MNEEGLSVYDIGLSLSVHEVLTEMAASDKLPLDMTQLDIIDVFRMAKESINKKKNEDVYEEGDVYFPIEITPEGEVVIHRSIWDDVSEEIKKKNPNHKAFRTLREALNYLHSNTNYEKVKYYDSQTFKIIDIEI